MKQYMCSKVLITILTLISVLVLITGASHALIIRNGCGDGMSDFGTSCSLSELAGGGSITIDDKLFDSWIFNGDSNSSLINVVPLGEGTLNPGLLYNPAVDEWKASNGSVFDEIQYDVSTTSGLARIHDNELILEVINIVGSPFMQVAEQVIDNATSNELANKVVFLGGPLTASVTFPFNSASANVFWSVDLEAGPDEFAQVLTIQQTFSQIPGDTSIPEPSTMLLVGSGILGLGVFRKKFKK